MVIPKYPVTITTVQSPFDTSLNRITNWPQLQMLVSSLRLSLRKSLAKIKMSFCNALTVVMHRKEFVAETAGNEAKLSKSQR